MQFPHRVGLHLVVQSVLLAGLTSQVITLPAGMEHLSGSTTASQPFTGSSARYLQVHDAADLAGANGRRPFLAKSLSFRASGTTSFAARKWNVQLTMAYTTRTAATISTTFADNLGKAPTIVLPYTLVSSPGGKGAGSSPNGPAWRLPFRTPFVCDARLGNLCWQWQHHSSTTTTAVSMDAVQGTALHGGVRLLPSLGTGCTASGQARPAVADLRILQGYVDAHLLNAPANTPALAWVGLQRRQLQLPGFCAPLLVEPLLELRGRTNASGWWYAGSLSTFSLNKPPYAEMYLQYAFADPSLAFGVGLSDLAVVATPTGGGRFVSSIATRSDTLNNRHLDTLGQWLPNSGLIALFE